MPVPVPAPQLAAALQQSTGAMVAAVAMPKTTTTTVTTHLATVMRTTTTMRMRGERVGAEQHFKGKPASSRTVDSPTQPARERTHLARLLYSQALRQRVEHDDALGVTAGEEIAATRVEGERRDRGARVRQRVGGGDVGAGK